MPKRIMTGTVVSTKGSKTAVVMVERRVLNPLYKKFVRRTKRYMAHDEMDACQMGERVRIEECRPISKRKTWVVLKPEADSATS